MITYKDKKGVPIQEGDILQYDEGPGGSVSIDEVINIEGRLHSKTHVFYNQHWRIGVDEKPISLEFFMGFLSSNDTAQDAVIIGDIRINPEYLTIEHAETLWPNYSEEPTDA